MLLAFVRLTFPPCPEVKVEALIRAPLINSNRGVVTVILPAFPKVPAPPREHPCRGRLEREPYCWIVYKTHPFRCRDNDVAGVTVANVCVAMNPPFENSTVLLVTDTSPPFLNVVVARIRELLSSTNRSAFIVIGLLPSELWLVIVLAVVISRRPALSMFIAPALLKESVAQITTHCQL